MVYHVSARTLCKFSQKAMVSRIGLSLQKGVKAVSLKES